ncbi:hypothetical protein APHAL10511_000029 [Amanita phalloides]|nr:hypothetical protein APHAL10511_000029 [Amanita phalloides]
MFSTRIFIFVLLLSISVAGAPTGPPSEPPQPPNSEVLNASTMGESAVTHKRPPEALHEKEDTPKNTAKTRTRRKHIGRILPLKPVNILPKPTANKEPVSTLLAYHPAIPPGSYYVFDLSPADGQPMAQSRLKSQEKKPPVGPFAWVKAPSGPGDPASHSGHQGLANPQSSSGQPTSSGQQDLANPSSNPPPIGNTIPPHSGQQDLTNPRSRKASKDHPMSIHNLLS